MNLRVVKENDSASAHLGQPRFKIMTHGFIRVQAVNVEKVNASVCEIRQGLVEG